MSVFTVRTELSCAPRLCSRADKQTGGRLALNPYADIDSQPLTKGEMFVSLVAVMITPRSLAGFNVEVRL